MDLQQLRTVVWFTIVGSLASVVGVIPAWDTRWRALVVACAIILPLATAAFELQKGRLSLFFSGIHRYYAEFRTRENTAVLDSVRKEYFYLGVTFSSVLAGFREWYGSPERRGNVKIRLLLVNPEADDVLRFQARYETSGGQVRRL
ncbi:MAG TPA: hypothetical protein VH640_03405 [Bryobacteraceae bacterium]|jgi:hypothetical protein